MSRRRLHDRYFKQAKAEGYLARSAYKLIEINDKRRLIRKGDAVLDLGCAPGSWLQVAARLVGPRGTLVGIDLKAVDHERAGLGDHVRTIVADVTEIKEGIGDQAAGGREEKDVQREGYEGREEREGKGGPSASAGSSGTPAAHKAPATADEQDTTSPAFPSAQCLVPRASPPAFPSAQCLVPRAFFDVVLSDMAPDTTGSGDAFLSERLCRTVLDLLPGVLAPGGNLAMKVLEGEPYPALLRDTSAMFISCKGLKPNATRDVSREIYIVALGYRPPRV